MLHVTQLANVNSQFVRMDYQSLCNKCNKNIGSSVFMLDQPHLKYHYSCFIKRQ